MAPLAASVLLILVGALWLALAALANEPRVSIRTHGGSGFAPRDYAVTIIVEPHAENRQLILETVGAPGEYRRSDRALNGDKAARVRQEWIKGVAAGCYTFRASVADNAAIRASAESHQVIVYGIDGHPCPPAF